MTSRPRQRQEGDKMRKKMSKEQLHLALTKKRECDARALRIVERLIENKVDRTWMLENLEHINQCHMEDVAEERAILKRCGYALCDNPLKVTINQKYHISTRSNKVYDVSRRKNFCSNNCYGAANFLLEQMLTSPLWLRDSKEKHHFELFPVSGFSRKSTPGDEVDLGRENISVDPIKSDENRETQNSHDSLPTEDSFEKNFTSEATDDSVDTEAKEESNGRFVRESLREALNSEQTITNLIEGTAIERADTSGVSCDSKSNEIRITETKIPEENHVRKKRERTKPTSDKFDSNRIVERIERYLREWITLDSLALLLRDPTLKQEKIGEIKGGFENEELRKKYAQLCRKVNSLQIGGNGDDEEIQTDLRPLPDYHLLKEEGKKLEVKVKAFFEGRTVTETPTPNEDSSGEQTEYSSFFSPTLSEKEPRASRRRIVLEKLDKVLPEMLRTLAGGEFAVPECVSSNGCGKTVKALVNTFSLSASNVIPKPAEWNLLGLVFIKLLSILEPRLRFLLGTERAMKYTTMILMSYNLEPNYLDGLVASATDIEVYRKKEASAKS